MASVASQMIEEFTAHAQRYSLEDAWEICADGTCFPNNLRNNLRNVGTYTRDPFKKVLALRKTSLLNHVMAAWWLGLI